MSLPDGSFGLDSAAPSECVRLHPACFQFVSSRSRRRGPRSQVSLLRRSVPRHRRTLPDTCPGESGHLVSETFSQQSPQHVSPNSTLHENQIFFQEEIGNAPKLLHPSVPRSNLHANENVFQEVANDARNSLHDLCIYTVNIQCLLAHLDELCFQLELYRPHVVCIQETWLDETRPEIKIPGYEVCSRRDRHAGANRGGIITLRRDDFNGLVHIANTADEERSWHFLKVGIDTILLANWYRPGASVHDGFSTLYSEMAEYFQGVTGVVLVGDLNIHHKRWLRYSNDDTRIGSEMQAFCDFHGLLQHVKEPARKEYLLDLAMTDIPGASATTLAYIADHKGVRLNLPIAEVKEVAVKRTVWMIKDADWPALEKELNEIDWAPLKKGTAEDAVMYFMDILWTLLVKHIPRKQIQCKRSSHPWLNSRCRTAIIHKNNSESKANFQEMHDQCDLVLREERAKYVEKLKAKLAGLPRSCKQWWSINRELLHRKANVKSIPPLKEDSTWLVDARSKANAFAKKFAFKNVLPAEVVDTPFFGSPDMELDDFVPLRTRYTKKLFKELDSSKATGPDQISAVILKRLGNSLAMPFTRVCRRLFYEGCWPTIWKTHLIVPIYKKGSAFKADNYRGVHLTSILSKLAEKVIGKRLVPFLQRNVFGENQ